MREQSCGVKKNGLAPGRLTDVLKALEINLLSRNLLQYYVAGPRYQFEKRIGGVVATRRQRLNPW